MGQAMEKIGEILAKLFIVVVVLSMAIISLALLSVMVASAIKLAIFFWTFLLG